MHNMGVIKISHSDCGSPVILVPKTDGPVCFYVDTVNTMANFYVCPMPHIDELLNQITFIWYRI